MQLFKVFRTSPHRSIIATFVVCLFPALCLAQISTQTTVAVLDLDISGGIPQEYQRTLSDKLRQELFATGRFVVIERNRMEDILGEQGFQLAGCTSAECAVEVGKLLGVREIIAGSIGRVGQAHSVIVRRIDVETGEIVDAKSVECLCTIEDVLSTRLRQVAYMMAGLAPPVIPEVTSPGAGTVAGVGDLFIKSEPDGAAIWIDGKPRPETTPAMLEKLAAGPHTVRVQKNNLVGQRQIFVDPNSITRIEIPMATGRVSLRITSTPYEATVILDGERIGPTPQVVNDLEAGDHRLRLEHEEYLPLEKIVRLKAGEENRVDWTLTHYAGLEIITVPEGAEIAIDGRPYGTAPLSFNNAKPGEYKIATFLRGYKIEQQTVQLEAGQTEQVRFNLEKIYATLRIESELGEAMLTIDDSTRKVRFPVGTALPFGTHTVTVNKDRFEPWQNTVTLTEERIYTLRANPQPYMGFLDISRIIAGTRVYVDGKHIGTVPMSNPSVTVGKHIVTFKRTGYTSSELLQVNITRGSQIPVTAGLIPKTRNKALLRSAILPGLGQLYAERGIGVVYLLGELAASEAIIYSINEYNSSVNKYDAAQALYESAISMDQIATTKERRDHAWDNVQRKQQIMIAAAAVAGGLYIWNLADIVIFGIKRDDSPRSSLHGNAGGFIQPTLVRDSRGEAVPGISFRLSGGF
ncbi:MAG: PEGA domain-containing protein [bacterium]